MVLPLVVIDLHAKLAKYADYVQPLDDMRDWGQCRDRLPIGAFMSMRTELS